MILRSRLFDSVAVAEMNRPERRNAMNTALLQSLLEALRGFRSDDKVGAVVLTGALGTFSSGADLSERTEGAAAELRARLFSELYETLGTFPKPTVAAIAGPCIGGGAEAAASCDLRVGVPGVQIRFPGSRLGIPVGSARLPLLIGLSHAKDLLLTSRTIGTEEAYRIGFLNRVVEAKDLEHESVALAAAIAANPGAVMQKRLIDQATGLSERVLSENRTLYRFRTDAMPER